MNGYRYKSAATDGGPGGGNLKQKAVQNLPEHDNPAAAPDATLMARRAAWLRSRFGLSYAMAVGVASLAFGEARR
jgi:hypothetical protein